MTNLDLGANFQEDGTLHFRVWAPFQNHIQVKLFQDEKSSLLPLEKDEKGYFEGAYAHIRERDRYCYILDKGQERPDPVSRALPQGVFGPTEIINPKRFSWTDQNWKGIALEKCIFFECHVGTFTKEGTFDGVQRRLDYLKNLGINCLQIMPVASFSGRWSWGYDGVSPFAPCERYGGVHQLKTLIDECHKRNIAVSLDVVYNHMGPEGCFLNDFGPYFTKSYQTPWGDAINMDGAYSDHVRHYFLQNALYWISEYHVDVLRLDALHALYDFSASPFLACLSEEIKKLSHALNRPIYLIGEDDRNDSRLLKSVKNNGMGLNGWWNDDFHHALHVALTKEKQQYYADFSGLADVKKVYKEKVVYSGQYSSFRKRSQGNSFQGIDPQQMVAFLQNHDQVGNRPFGDRLSLSLTFAQLKTAAVTLLFSPFLPLIFMGEEYGEKAPFAYFVDFTDPTLLSNVWKGRKESVGDGIEGEEAFFQSQLKGIEEENQQRLFELYRDLIHLRHSHSDFFSSRKKIKLFSKLKEEWISWQFSLKDEHSLTVLSYFGQEEKTLLLPFDVMTPLLSTEMKRYGGEESFENGKTLRVFHPTALIWKR